MVQEDPIEGIAGDKDSMLFPDLLLEEDGSESVGILCRDDACARIMRDSLGSSPGRSQIWMKAVLFVERDDSMNPLSGHRMIFGDLPHRSPSFPRIDDCANIPS